MPSRTDDEIEADDVVVGGGPAGCWAALSAAEQGARVVLVDKGYVGTSGATAAGNTTIIDVVPGSLSHREAVERRRDRGGGLVEEAFVDRVFEETHRQLGRLTDWGYGFPTTDDDVLFRGSMRGVDYLFFMRRRLLKAGVTILDHSPADALLAHDGAAAGVTGWRRRSAGRWSARAGAVVIASGGCAFLSGALGTNNLTGDGYLMAAELGASFAGMDFTGQYGIAPKGSSVTKGIIYFWASFFDAEGKPLDAAGDRQELVARNLANGPVYAVLDKAPERLREGMRHGQPNIFLPFDRQGIDPFTQRFEVSLLYEGTVRGVGGILIDPAAASDVPGLFAAGDAAAREPMSGATSGGGGPNASWAMATGVWAGQSAAKHARELGRHAASRPAEPAYAGLPDARIVHHGEVAEIIRGIQAEILPLDRSFYRSSERLARSSTRLDLLWEELRGYDPRAPDAGHRREAKAMLATARWIVESARKRPERRGIHRREDSIDLAGGTPPGRILSGGLEHAWARHAGQGLAAE